MSFTLRKPKSCRFFLTLERMQRNILKRLNFKMESFAKERRFYSKEKVRSKRFQRTRLKSNPLKSNLSEHSLNKCTPNFSESRILDNSYQNDTTIEFTRIKLENSVSNHEIEKLKQLLYHEQAEITKLKGVEKASSDQIRQLTRENGKLESAIDQYRRQHEIDLKNSSKSNNRSLFIVFGVLTTTLLIILLGRPSLVN